MTSEGEIVYLEHTPLIQQGADGAIHITGRSGRRSYHVVMQRPMLHALVDQALAIITGPERGDGVARIGTGRRRAKT
jgi:hypothetical protein